MAWKLPTEIVPVDFDEEIEGILQHVNDFLHGITGWIPGSQRQRTLEERQARNYQRRLNHAIQQPVVPFGCELTFEHDLVAGELTDLVTCPNYCGEGQTMTYRITSLCDGIGPDSCVSYIDCKVTGCNDDCGDAPGDCAFCDNVVFLEEVCLEVCPNLLTETPTASPTLEPTPEPSPEPSPEPTPEPTPERTPEPTRGSTSSPTSRPTSTPVEMPVSPPVMASPTGSPVAPTVLPSPSPAIAPATVVPIAPTAAPVHETEVPSFSPAIPPPRQTVIFEGCRFTNNKQGGSTSSLTKGIIVVETELNDVVVVSSDFTGNDFGNAGDEVSFRKGSNKYAWISFSLFLSCPQLGYGVLIEEGSTLEIRDSCFQENNFTGPGSVVVISSLGSPSFSAANNSGTLDDDLTCQFIATVAKLGGAFNASCTDFDLSECIRS